ncbi:MAG: hypothetical protein DI621_31410 [Pseudomonas protegens]|nr:MAG: hypothetical protein DI621_31410 [Pseudomonas protegens]
MKTGSACSFRPLDSASSPAFALPDLCSASFRTDLRGGRLSPPGTRGSSTRECRQPGTPRGFSDDHVHGLLGNR